MFEMVLPVSQGTWICKSSQNFPLALQRSEYLSRLPANVDLLMALEIGFDSGSAYRVDWQELPLGGTSFSDEQNKSIQEWSDEELQIWVRVIIRRAAALGTLLARSRFIQMRWLEAKAH